MNDQDWYNQWFNMYLSQCGGNSGIAATASTAGDKAAASAASSGADCACLASADPMLCLSLGSCL